MKRVIWAWSWLCFVVVFRLPYQFTSTRLGHSLLPWAGLYGCTDGGWREFNERATVKGFQIAWNK